MKLISTILILVMTGVILMALGVGQDKAVVRFSVRLDIVGLDGVSRSGSSVWESQISANPFGGYHMTLRGEAVVVSDGANGIYAGLLRSTYKTGGLGADQTVMLPERLFKAEARPFLRGSEVSNRVLINRTIAQHPGWSSTMSYADGLVKDLPLPFLVHFPDRSSPANLTSATPTSDSSDPRTRVTITVTDAKVSTGITGSLPWLRTMPRSSMLDGKKYDISKRSGLANRIGTGDFSTEIQ